MPRMTIRVDGRDGGQGKTRSYYCVTTADDYIYCDVMDYSVCRDVM